MNKNHIVINFFGEPGAGKSTTAAYVYSELKKKGYNCEYLQEFAKQKLYENVEKVFKCEPYIFGKQLYRLQSINDNVDVIITDSPLLLPMFYEKDEYVKELMKDMSLHYFYQFNNINFMLHRDFDYEKSGRFQTEDEAEILHQEITKFLHNENIYYTDVNTKDVNKDFINNLCEIIKNI